MPSPVAHSLIGLGLAAAWRWPAGWRRSAVAAHLVRCWPVYGAAVVLANVPDLDYVPGLLAGDLNAWHHGPSHAVLWVVAVAVAVGLATCAALPGRFVTAMGFSLLMMGSHLAADWLTLDIRPPIGIPLGWPFSTRALSAPWPLFPNFHKGNLSELFSATNLAPVLTELLLAGLLLALIIAWKHGLKPRSGAE